MPACRSVTLWACLKLTSTGDRLYVLPLAIDVPVVADAASGVFYHGLTGRKVPAISGSDYRPMVADRARLRAGARRWHHASA